MEELEFQLMQPSNKKENPYIHEKVNKEITFYLFGEIGRIDEYIDELNVLRGATANDTVNIIINNYGGNLDTAVLLMDAIKSCAAHVVAHVSMAYSAATFITLACDDVVFLENSVFMLHTVQLSNIGGKSSDIKVRQKFDEKYFKTLMYSVYLGFLNEAEIEELLEDGREFYFSQEDAQERHTAYVQHKGA